MILENKKILVTGGAGFIGSNIIEYLLQKDNKITCLDNLITGKKENIEEFQSNPNFNFIEGDITNIKDCDLACNGNEIILHQAALGSVPRSIENPIRTNEININGFLNILWSAKQHNIKRVVYAASSSTYGDSQKLPKVENEIGLPLSPYAVTKYVNELYAGVFSNLYNLELIGLRYFNVFGRRQDPNGAYAAAIPKFVKAFINHESPVIHGDGSQSRDFTYIDNVIQANELAATTTNKQAINQVYNVACGNQSFLSDLVEKLKELLSKFDSDIENLVISYGDERIGDIKHSLASIDKAKKLLNYQPSHNVEDGLNEAIDWYWNYFNNKN
jgi:UDP-N-acetylglucosamine 4-epimerase